MEACLSSMIVSFSFTLNTHRTHNPSRTPRHGVKNIKDFATCGHFVTSDTVSKHVRRSSHVTKFWTQWTWVFVRVSLAHRQKTTKSFAQNCKRLERSIKSPSPGPMLNHFVVFSQIPIHLFVDFLETRFVDALVSPQLENQTRKVPEECGGTACWTESRWIIRHVLLKIVSIRYAAFFRAGLCSSDAIFFTCVWARPLLPPPHVCHFNSRMACWLYNFRLRTWVVTWSERWRTNTSTLRTSRRAENFTTRDRTDVESSDFIQWDLFDTLPFNALLQHIVAHLTNRCAENSTFWHQKTKFFPLDSQAIGKTHQGPSSCWHRFGINGNMTRPNPNSTLAGQMLG